MKKTSLLKSMLLLCALIVGSGSVWADYEELYSATFTSLDAFSYTQNKTFTLSSKDWKASIAQLNSSVFYLGCNSSNAAKGILNNNDDFSDEVTALCGEDDTYNDSKATAHAYALQFDNSYDDVTKIEFNWAGGNSNFLVYLFGDSGSGYELLEKTDYSSYSASTAGSVVWTGSATDFTKFAVVARPYGVNTSSLVTNKTLRATTFKIYETAAGPSATLSTTTLAFGNVEVGKTKSMTFTVTPADLTGDLTIACANAKYTVSPTSIAQATTTATTITVTAAPTATSDDMSGTVSISGGGIIAKSVTLSATPKEYIRYKKAVSVTSGKSYLIVANNRIAKPLTSNYGNLTTVAAETEGDLILIEDDDNAFTFNTTTGGYTIENGGYYYYKTGSYDNFNRASSLTGEYVWTVTRESDGTFTINNVGKDKFFSLDSSSNQFVSYNTNKGYLPYLYEQVEDISVTIGADKYATFSDNIARDFSGSGITVYTAKATASSVNFTTVADGKVPANTGVVLYSATSTTQDIPAVLTAVPALADNEMVANVARTSVTDDGGSSKVNYILAKKTGVVGFYKAAAGGAYLAEHKAYLSTATAAAARDFLSLDGETTAIEKVESTQKNVVEYYNLAGQRVAQPTKGLYIVNGKKVIK